MSQLLSKTEAQREVNSLVHTNPSWARELADYYRVLYPNFSDGLHYSLTDHLGDYRVSTERVRY